MKGLDSDQHQGMLHEAFDDVRSLFQRRGAVPLLHEPQVQPAFVGGHTGNATWDLPLLRTGSGIGPAASKGD